MSTGGAEEEPRAGAWQDRAVQRPVRVVELSPRIGPPGTRVTLRSRRLPAVTPVQLAIGATRSGFEGLTLGQTDANGELEAAVEVPSWTRRDQTHRFIIFNLYFTDVLAESGIFHVTDEDGAVVREGAIGSSESEAGSPCTTLEGDDGERYRLIGATGGRGTGDRVVVEGVLAEAEEGCGEDLSLELELTSIRSASRPIAGVGS